VRQWQRQGIGGKAWVNQLAPPRTAAFTFCLPKPAIPLSANHFRFGRRYDRPKRVETRHSWTATASGSNPTDPELCPQPDRP
jgi:hypothetical protein